MHVVIVEDHEDALAGLVEYLSLCGFQPTGVTRAEECLEHCGRHAVDVVITDINLPGLSGVDLANRLSMLKPPPRVLGMSGGVPEDAVSGIFQHFLPKPVDLERLCQILNDD